MLMVGLRSVEYNLAIKDSVVLKCAKDSMQLVKTGYYDTLNVFRDAIKGKDEKGNNVYLIPCPAGITNVKLQANWHYASEDEDLPDLATKADGGLQFIQSHRRERDPFGL
ncbi:unnamed protein product [Cylindrotheca closterium]|uniref:Uncharacterized protein n=1 Tax=Cylindrotheca closterium TaxID=2856 RepID=A0AAD2FH20_9STRA|nr:unnamed protein product [Cylindrotheca closterium]